MYHLLFIFRNLSACASFQLEAALTDLDPYSLSSSQIQMFPQGSPEVKFSSHTRIATTYSTTRQQKKKKLFHTHTCTDTVQTTGGAESLRLVWGQLNFSPIQSVEVSHWSSSTQPVSGWPTFHNACDLRQGQLHLMTHLFRTIDVCVETLLTCWKLTTHCLVVAQWWKWHWIFPANNCFSDVIGRMNLIRLFCMFQPDKL